MSEIVDWATAVAGRLNADQRNYSESIPLDYILGESYQPNRMVEQSFAVYRELIQASSAWGEQVMPRLSLLLSGELDHLAGVDTVGSDVFDQVDPERVPTFYLTLRTLSAFWFGPTWEEYRAPLDLTLPEFTDLSHISVSYVCFRSRQAGADPWFTRGLWLDQHPFQEIASVDLPDR